MGVSVNFCYNSAAQQPTRSSVASDRKYVCIQMVGSVALLSSAGLTDCWLAAGRGWPQLSFTLHVRHGPAGSPGCSVMKRPMSKRKQAAMREPFWACVMLASTPLAKGSHVAERRVPGYGQSTTHHGKAVQSHIAKGTDERWDGTRGHLCELPQLRMDQQAPCRIPPQKVGLARGPGGPVLTRFGWSPHTPLCQGGTWPSSRSRWFQLIFPCLSFLPAPR